MSLQDRHSEPYKRGKCDDGDGSDGEMRWSSEGGAVTLCVVYLGSVPLRKSNALGVCSSHGVSYDRRYPE